MENSDIWELIDHEHEMVITFDYDGKINYANRESERVLHYEDELNTHNSSEIFPRELTIENGKFFCVSTDKGTVQTMAYRENRTCFAVELRIHEFDGRMVCHALDITEKNILKKRQVIPTRR